MDTSKIIIQCHGIYCLFFVNTPAMKPTVFVESSYFVTVSGTAVTEASATVTDYHTL